MSIAEADQAAPDRTSGKNRPTPKRPRKGVSGNPAKRAGQSTAKEVPAAEAHTPAPGRPVWKFLTFAAIILALTGTYTTSVLMLPASGDSFVLLCLLTVPALITMVFVPPARSTGIYRWPVAWVLGFTSMYPLPMLVMAQAWVLIRFWLVEYDPRLPNMRRTARPGSKDD